MYIMLVMKSKSIRLSVAVLAGEGILFTGLLFSDDTTASVGDDVDCVVE